MLGFFETTDVETDSGVLFVSVGPLVASGCDWVVAVA